jgi:tetratricopeptide (TPR) repeat protein
MVNEEIREFRRLNGNKNILCLITSGEPSVFNFHTFEKYQADKALPDNACFPPALFETEVEYDGLPHTSSEPLAADVRIGGDGKKNAYLKIAAGMLGINLGELVRRDLIKRQRQTILALLLSLSVSATMGWTAWTAVHESRRAENHKVKTQKFANYLAGIVYDELPKTGRLDLLEETIDQLIDYYDELPVESVNELYDKAHTITKIALASDTISRQGTAIELHNLAIDLIDQLLALEPENEKYLYLMAQNYRGLSLTLNWMGNIKEALNYNIKNKDILLKLIRQKPTDEDLIIELGVVYTAAGVIYAEFLEDVEKAQAEFEEAFKWRLKATKIQGVSDIVYNYLGAAYNNLARMNRILGPADDMIQNNRLSHVAMQKYHDLDKVNKTSLFVLALNVREMAMSERFNGKMAEALRSYEKSIEEFNRLEADNPGGDRIRTSNSIGIPEYIETLIVEGYFDRAQAVLAENDLWIRDFMAGHKGKYYGHSVIYYLDYVRARLALETGDTVLAKQRLIQILDNLDKDRERNFLKVTRMVKIYTAAYLLYGQILKAEGDQDRAQKVWQKAVDTFGQNLPSKRMDIRGNIAQLYMELGRNMDAQALVDDLHARGYREAGYIRIIEAVFNEGLLKKPDGWQPAPLPVKNEGKAAS